MTMPSWKPGELLQIFKRVPVIKATEPRRLKCMTCDFRLYKVQKADVVHSCHNTPSAGRTTSSLTFLANGLQGE